MGLFKYDVCLFWAFLNPLPVSKIQLRRLGEEYGVALKQSTGSLRELVLDREDVPPRLRPALGQALLNRRQEEAEMIEQAETQLQHPLNAAQRLTSPTLPLARTHTPPPSPGSPAPHPALHCRVTLADSMPPSLVTPHTSRVPDRKAE